MMEKAMQRTGMDWPKLEGSDLVHIVAYVRSTGASGEKTYLSPGSVARGERRFLEKGCNVCHPGSGPDLSGVSLPSSVAALASRMWNHSPTMTQVMREQDVQRQTIDPQELADILAYVLALGHQDRGGDPARGHTIFRQKGCSQCHDSQEEADDIAPVLAQLGADATPVSMAAAMWNHGDTMLDRMTEAGMSWPVFEDTEMVDLLAYLQSIGPSTATQEMPRD